MLSHLPHSPTFASGPPDLWERASYHAGHLSLKCFHQNGRPKKSQDPIPHGFVLFFRAKHSWWASRCLCHKSNGQPMGSWKQPLSFKTFWLTKLLLHSHRDSPAGFWKCKRCPSRTNMLYVGSFSVRFTHTWSHEPFCSKSFPGLWLQSSMVPLDVSSSH